jgi:hypothetical protein
VIDEFEGPYPSKCYAFLVGRIIYRKFKNEIGIEVPAKFKSSFAIPNNGGEPLILFNANGLYFTFDGIKETIFLNTRLGVLEWDEDNYYNILIKWADSEGIE